MALLDRVKFDGPPDVLVWKWPSDSITLGAQLIVNESQQALFYKGGEALDLFQPGTHTLSSGNLPVLHKLINLPFGGKTPFAAEVYFVSTAVAVGLDWGTKTPFMILDPRYNVSVPLRAYGQFALRVSNAREFVTEIAGASGGGTRGTVADHRLSTNFVSSVAPVMQGRASNSVATTANDTARSMLEALIVTAVQQAIGTYLQIERRSVLDLPASVLSLASGAHQLLKTSYRTFGLELLNFTLESVNFDPKDESVQRLRSMLDEAARLDVVGGAFRRNEDFYRVERQFDALQGAAESDGAAGAMMGTAVGLGMGFGAAPSAAALTRDAMTPSPAQHRCSQCGAVAPTDARFCQACGSTLVVAGATPCDACGAPLAATSRFCPSCGASRSRKQCSNCSQELSPGARFCGSCGQGAS